MVVGIVTSMDLSRNYLRNRIDWIRCDILDNQTYREPKIQQKMKTYLSFQSNLMKAKLETVKDNLIFAFGETHTLNGRDNINETIDIVEELIRSADALEKSIQTLSEND